MKKLLIAVLLFMLIDGAKAQKTADVGIWGGTGTSFGDMTQVNMERSLGFNYGAFVRYNFNPRVAARLQLMNGAIKGDGKFDSNSWDFGPKNVTSLSVMAEINFFRYYLGDKKTPFTTYLLGGLGVGMYPYDYDYPKLSTSTNYYDIRPFLNGAADYNYVPMHPIVNYLSDPAFVEAQGLNSSYSENVSSLHIPFGFGVKFNLGEKIGLGFELLFNRYFNDKLDDLDDPRRSEKVDINGNKTWMTYNDKWHNNDYTMYLGLHLTYKINLSKMPCPVYEYE